MIEIKCTGCRWVVGREPTGEIDYARVTKPDCPIHTWPGVLALNLYDASVERVRRELAA